METVIQKSTIASKAALAAVSAAVAHGQTIGCKVVAAVVDSGGNLLACLRDDGAFLHSISIAQDKAYTALGFGIPTTTLYDAIKEPTSLRDGIMHRDRLIVFGGGFPIVVDGQVVGGIGVSGASEEQDSACAQAGLRTISL